MCIFMYVLRLPYLALFLHLQRVFLSVYNIEMFHYNVCAFVHMNVHLYVVMSLCTYLPKDEFGPSGQVSHMPL